MENKNIHINQLMIPIWPLYNATEIDEIKLNKESVESFKKGYSLKRRLDIYKALKWAKDNATYNFNSIMKDAPHPKDIKFNNKEIYNHLINFKEFMENKEFNLLTDESS